MNQEGCYKDCHLKLATAGKVACLIEGYTVHSHKFSMENPRSNRKRNDLPPNKVKDEKARLQNLRMIFISISGIEGHTLGW